MKNISTIATATCRFLFLLLLGACSPKSAAKSTNEIAGTQSERVTEISNMISKHTPLPSPLLDAHFIEEQIGDGRLGPSDYKSFYAFTVAPADLPLWRTALSSAKPLNHFSNDDEIKRVVPTKAQSWWVTAADLGKLEFYSPQALTGQADGWVGIAPDGRIFIYTFTM